MESKRNRVIWEASGSGVQEYGVLLLSSEQCISFSIKQHSTPQSRLLSNPFQITYSKKAHHHLHNSGEMNFGALIRTKMATEKSDGFQTGRY